jgi:hypothetical protein
MASPTPNPDLFTAARPEKTSRLPWILAGAVVLIIAVAVIFANRGSGPPKLGANGIATLDRYAANLPISGVQMSQASSMVGTQATYIDGTITNKGNKTVTGVTVQVVFPGYTSPVAQTVILPLNLIRTRQPYVDTEPVSAAPIQPGQSASFRLILDHVSEDWNQQYPQIRVVQVATK